jgi:hypothetical protein
MAKIKVTRGGCGIAYKDAHGNPRYALKTPENGPFECDDAQAARLVGLGVAEYVGAHTPVGDEQQQEQPDGSQETEKSTGHLDAEQLETMTNEQLKALAADMGVDVTGCKKKADYIAAIVAVEVEIDDEVDPDEDDGNELPELNAADPE